MEKDGKIGFVSRCSEMTLWAESLFSGHVKKNMALFLLIMVNIGVIQNVSLIRPLLVTSYCLLVLQLPATVAYVGKPVSQDGHAFNFSS